MMRSSFVRRRACFAGNRSRIGRLLASNDAGCDCISRDHVRKLLPRPSCLRQLASCVWHLARCLRAPRTLGLTPREVLRTPCTMGLTPREVFRAPCTLSYPQREVFRTPCTLSYPQREMTFPQREVLRTPRTLLFLLRTSLVGPRAPSAEALDATEVSIF